MYFGDGTLLDASFRNLKGIEAAYTIISWKNVEIEIDSSCPATKQNIEKPLGFILLEGSRRKDENNAATGSYLNADRSGSLKSLNMEELDLDLSTKSSPLRERTKSQDKKPLPQLKVVNTNPEIAQFISLLSSFPEINSITISSREGTILHQAGHSDGNTGSFITYVAAANKQIGSAIGASGVQSSTFTLLNDSRLLILFGKDIVVGLNLDGTIAPDPIADGLRPALNRISI